VAAAAVLVAAAPRDAGEMKRLLSHLTTTRWQVRRAFPERVLGAIEAAIRAAEKNHGGEIRFAIEGDLPTLDVLRRCSPRERALQVFAHLGVWDTHANNGVLIYVLYADRDVEIVADRGFNNLVSSEEWTRVCSKMETLFRAGDFERGVAEGIAAVSHLIARHFPTTDRNELPDRPVML
jgi:hypothetical protein